MQKYFMGIFTVIHGAGRPFRGVDFVTEFLLKIYGKPSKEDSLRWRRHRSSL
jgi:hypothetical protein